MSTEQDILAGRINAAIEEWDAMPAGQGAAHVATHVAAALTAAGYTKPRQVTTVEELDALKLPAIIHAQNGGHARVDYYYGPGRQKYVEHLFGEDDRDYSLAAFAEAMGAATVLAEEAQ